MKKIWFVIVLCVLAFGSMAQDPKKEKKKPLIKLESLFTGGNLTASFYSRGLLLGVNPYFGFSLNKYIDVAASINFNYGSQRDNIDYGDRIRQTIYGPGAFVRLYPIRFLFAQVQYEHNFIRQKYTPADNSFYLPSTVNFDANSVLVGGGYTSGRRDGNNTYYYLSIMWDITRVPESPYIDGLGRNFPVIRAGYNIALFQHNRGR